MSAYEFYKYNGYVIFPSLIPLMLIDTLLSYYQQQIIPSRYPFFRQSTNAYEPSRTNEYGYILQSFLDIHDYRAYPEFSLSVKEIFLSESLLEALRQTTGFKSFNLMQSMLFDANTASEPHQDWWYLDTVPKGYMTAAWIALEDIDERAGRFFLLPRSHHIDFFSNDPYLPHSVWLANIKKYFELHKDETIAPPLKKGDVLFWNSGTIHGSFPTQDPKFSRKSLTAHYIPSEFAFGNLFVTKDYIKYKNYKGIKYYRNQPDYSLLNNLIYKLKIAAYDSPKLIWKLRKLQRIMKFY